FNAALASKPGPDADSSHHDVFNQALEEQNKPGIGEALGRGALQGASLGFSDEAAGAIEAIADKLRGAHETIGELYAKHRDESRAANKRAEEAHPTAFKVGDVGGGLATMAIPGLGIGGGAARAIGTAAALGGASGLGHSTAEDVGGAAADTLKGAG